MFPDAAEDRTTRVGGSGEAVKGGVAVVCKSMRKSEREWLWSAEKKKIFFFLIPRPENRIFMRDCISEKTNLQIR